MSKRRADLPDDLPATNGWKREGGKWVKVDDSGGALATVTVDLEGLDESLDASHKRMSRALAITSARLEAAALKSALGPAEIETMDRLSRTWRTLVANEPAPDWSNMTREQIEAALAGLNARARP